MSDNLNGFGAALLSTMILRVAEKKAQSAYSRPLSDYVHETINDYRLHGSEIDDSFYDLLMILLSKSWSDVLNWALKITGEGKMITLTEDQFVTLVTK
jgi:hypothetical protein